MDEFSIELGDTFHISKPAIVRVDRPADRDPRRVAVRIAYYKKEHLEGPAPEPLAEEAKQGPDGEAPAADGCVGAPGPLPDAGFEEVNVVEGVGGEPKPKRPLEIPGIGPESEVKILSAYTVVHLLIPGVSDEVALELDLRGKTRISARDRNRAIHLSTPHYNFLTVLADALRHFLRATLHSEED